MQYETEIIESLVRAAKLLCATDYECRFREIEDLDAERFVLLVLLPRQNCPAGFHPLVF